MKCLHRILNIHISPFQIAFNPRRWIAENIMIAQEVTSTIYKKHVGRRGLMGIKLDM